MAGPKVIVFGPTGAVGSSAARTVQRLGAQVVLAMRDTSKPIPGLDAEKERQADFERVTADLTKPDTVRDAVTKTGAKRAFMYLAFGSPDHMKSTIEALKSAGIELVVFLSSFTVQGDPAAIEPSQVIPYVHAQVELNLTEVFGRDGFVAARPGGFASNQRQYKGGFKEGVIKMFMPDATVDCIVPEDIGAVCGTVLAKGPQDDNRAIYLYGPELLTTMDTVKILGKVLGKDPKIEVADEQEAYRMFVEDRGVPPPIAKYMISRASLSVSAPNQVMGYAVTDDQLKNVEKYSGRKATTFEEWAVENKHTFTD